MRARSGDEGLPPPHPHRRQPQINGKHSTDFRLKMHAAFPKLQRIQFRQARAGSGPPSPVSASHEGSAAQPVAERKPSESRGFGFRA